MTMAYSRINSLTIFYLSFVLLIHLKKSFCVKDDPRCLSKPCQKDFKCSSAAKDAGCGCLDSPGDTLAKDCATADDPCSSRPCFHNATCLSTAGNPSFTCACPAGYNGTTCETAVGTCDSHVCRHGGTCRTEHGGVICFCTEGYMGTYCETDIDDCFSNPCLNGAVCRDRIGGYSCYCVPGYQGKHCDLEVNECVSEPCLNNATCLNLVGKYVCVCPPEYTGKRRSVYTHSHRCKHALSRLPLEDDGNSSVRTGSETCAAERGLTQCWSGRLFPEAFTVKKRSMSVTRTLAKMEEPVKILLEIIPAVAQSEKTMGCFMVAGTVQKSSLAVFRINVKMEDRVFLTSQMDNTDLVAFVHLDIPEYTVKQ